MNLHEASQSGDLERVVQLIDEGTDINAHWGFEKRTPLHWAVENNRLEVAQYLIRKGCLLEERDFDGRTPLIEAACVETPDLVKLLLASGADIGVSDLAGWNILHHAILSNNLDVVKIALEIGKIDVNKKTNFGETALILAVKENNRDVVNLLLASGVDIAACDEYNQNVLHHAARENSVDAARVLLQRGGLDVDMKNTYGDTAMMIAAINGQWAMFELLLSSGANVNVKNNKHFVNNETALYWVIKGEKVSLFQSLLSHGAYLESSSYQEIYNNEKMRKQILGDAKLCSAFILNKYNEDWLPSIYGKLQSAVELPGIESLKIYPFQNVATEIEKHVSEEIGSKGFCRVLDVRPPVLKWLCARSLAGYFSSLERPAPN